MTTPPPPASAAIAESEHPFRLLTAKLGEIFQIDRGDLDFGIYRLLNTKSAEIRQFLERDLLPQVKAELDQFASDQTATLQRQLANVKKSADDLDLVAEDVPKVRELQQCSRIALSGYPLFPATRLYAPRHQNPRVHNCPPIALTTGTL